MFGYVTASWKELGKEEQIRYNAVYCGICRQIRAQTSNLARLGLSYDMAFLALLHMSLYEPEEEGGQGACKLHPIAKRPWVDNAAVRYAADMNVLLTYYNLLDDWEDENRHSAKYMAEKIEPALQGVRERFPRQSQAVCACITRLGELEKASCPNPDEPAGVFGELMGEILVWREDLWAPILRQMGFWLGRFIYLLDGAVDYDKDKRRGRYNPYLAMGGGKDWQSWEEWLVLSMGKCTERFEQLPLVQDKAILDNILYSGVWMNYRGRRKEEEQTHDGRSV